MKVHMSAATHPGVQRSHNEDHVELWPEQRAWLVLDGMGGSYSGMPAVMSVARSCGTSIQNHSAESLDDIMIRANTALLDEIARNRRMQASGAAGMLGRVTGTRLEWAHVGDCRLYKMRDARLERLSREHTLFRALLERGELAPEDEENFPHKNVIMQLFGMETALKCEQGVEELREGDIYLACSDGLYEMLSDERIAHLLAHPEIHVDELADRLILEANMAGGEDNIAVMLMWVSSE